MVSHRVKTIHKTLTSLRLFLLRQMAFETKIVSKKVVHLEWFATRKSEKNRVIIMPKLPKRPTIPLKAPQPEGLKASIFSSNDCAWGYPAIGSGFSDSNETVM